MQLSRLLELPADAMNEEIQNAIDENPAIERDEHDTASTPDGTADNTLAEAFNDRADNTYVRRSTEENTTDLAEWLATESDDNPLKEQINELDLTEEEREAMEYLIGSLNDDGYIEKDDLTLSDELAFGLYIMMDAAEVHRLIGLLQTLEPVGIGAHTLQECLLLQLRAKQNGVGESADTAGEALTTAMRIVDTCFDDYANRRWEKVQNLLQISADMLQKADAIIRRCNPRPGAAVAAAGSIGSRAVTPDFYVTADENGHIDIELTWQHQPRLMVSRTFQEIVDEYATLTAPSKTQQDTYVYAKDKVDRATAYLDNLRRRREMLLSTMREIVRRQQPFFLHEDDESLLQPMKLQDVATAVGVDMSTISRAANSKYVETPFGIYPLRMFFNAQTMEKDGVQVSSVQLKVILRELIEGETPTQPYTDEQLVALMTARGYKIARRTVAKYRTQLGFLPHALRVKNIP